MNDAAPTVDAGGEDHGRRGQPVGSSVGDLEIPDVAAAGRPAVSKKGIFAIALLVMSLIAVSTISIQRLAAGSKKGDDAESKQASDRPAAATAEPRRLDMTQAPAASAVSRDPGLIPTPEEIAEPIGVRRTGQAPVSSRHPSPEDAPAVLVSSRPGTNHANGTVGQLEGTGSVADAPSGGTNLNGSLEQTRRNLEGYQRQLQGMLDTLSRSTAAAGGQTPAATSGVPSSLAALAPAQPAQGAGFSPAPALFGGQLPRSETPRVAAKLLGNRSLTLAKGTAFTCALKTRVVSAASGFIGCQVQRNVYSDDGRVLLIERGSHMDGEYRITSVRPGTVRIPILWSRIRTPNGVTVALDSPGVSALGESGIDGYVDNRWGERIGAAMLLSLIDDSVKLIIQNQANDRQGDTVILPSTTSNSSKLAEKVLDSTINIPPLIYRNQGGIVGVYVARDVDFSSVYGLKAVSR